MLTTRPFLNKTTNASNNENKNDKKYVILIATMQLRTPAERIPEMLCMLNIARTANNG
jgi:hypothetical protein